MQAVVGAVMRKLAHFNLRRDLSRVFRLVRFFYCGRAVQAACFKLRVIAFLS